MSNGHADISPSAASIWLKCPASVTLARGKARKGSVYTAEGTAAHEVADRLIHGLPVPDEMEIEGHTIEITDDMLSHVQVYVDYVEDLQRRSNQFSTEARVKLDWLPEPVFGTADVVAEIDHGRRSTIEIVDLKFGKGVEVEAVGNLQLRIYALGVLGGRAGKWISVKLTIIQPRVGDSAIKSEDLNSEDLAAWGWTVLTPAVQRIADGDTTENAGDHCRWCVRAGECKTLAALAMTQAQAAFSVIPEPKELVRGMDEAELAAALDGAELVIAWAALIRAEASQRADKGVVIPGWKLVPKRANRAWIDPEKTAGTLIEMGLYGKVTKLISPAAVERVLKAHKVDGKFLADHVTRPPTGSTLVRDDDAREGLRLDAKSSFTALE